MVLYCSFAACNQVKLEDGILTGNDEVRFERVSVAERAATGVTCGISIRRQTLDYYLHTVNNAPSYSPAALWLTSLTMQIIDQ